MKSREERRSSIKASLGVVPSDAHLSTAMVGVSLESDKCAGDFLFSTVFEVNKRFEKFIILVGGAIQQHNLRFKHSNLLDSELSEKSPIDDETIQTLIKQEHLDENSLTASLGRKFTSNEFTAFCFLKAVKMENDWINDKHNQLVISQFCGEGKKGTLIKMCDLEHSEMFILKQVDVRDIYAQEKHEFKKGIDRDAIRHVSKKHPRLSQQSEMYKQALQASVNYKLDEMTHLICLAIEHNIRCFVYPEQLPKSMQVTRQHFLQPPLHEHLHWVEAKHSGRKPNKSNTHLNTIPKETKLEPIYHGARSPTFYSGPGHDQYAEADNESLYKKALSFIEALNYELRNSNNAESTKIIVQLVIQAVTSLLKLLPKEQPEDCKDTAAMERATTPIMVR